MNAIDTPSLGRARVRPSLIHWPLRALQHALKSERRLALFALLLWAAMLPALLALGLDDRLLRGVSLWAKPLKFMASLGLFAMTTAWFVGLLPAERQRSRVVSFIAWTILTAGSLEIAYICLQAAMGQASHFNFSDKLHQLLYAAMGLGALAMTATQPLLAWQIARHGRPEVDAVWRAAAVAGLVMTFLLGAGAGGLLSAMQPPAGSGVPLLGWHLAGADLRPAHFLGLHAQQLLPLAALGLGGLSPRARRLGLLLLCIAYVALWAGALAHGLDGAVLTVAPYAAP